MDKRKLFYALPPGLRYLARMLYHLPSDMLDGLSGNRPPMVPPKGKIYTGGGDFIETGIRFTEYFKKYGALDPSNNVLDVGSGIGRMAIPLTKYLTDEARYEGFDVVKTGVDWCKREITSRHPNFTFKYVDLHNDLYKSTGNNANGYTFPYLDASFDFVYLISVFTHMSKEEVHHYLNEIYRVLKPGGRCFATFFTYDQKTVPSRENFQFKYQGEEFALMDKTVTAANIAFEREPLISFAQKIGYNLIFHNLGSWQVSDSDPLDFQDIFVFKKPE